MAAKAVYIGARPFQLYKEAYIKDFILAVSNSVYIPLSLRSISGDLLDQEYTTLKNKVEELLRA